MEDDGLFDQSRIEDEPFDALPPPLSPGQDQGDPFGDDENGDVSKLADVPEAKRKGVKRPQPKLDSNRLISERGLPALRTLFNDVQFKGNGHEAEDLRLLMKKMENWAHRLYPKLQFEDFINKVERLGAKKEVQTCLKRIRLDMPLTHEDYTSKEGEEEVPNDVQISGDPDPFGGEHLSVSPPRLVHSTPGPGAAAAHDVDLSLGSSPAFAPSLTEEQRRRMEENRRKALERKLAKQKRLQEESQSMASQSKESEPVPMDESTEVSSELARSPSEELLESHTGVSETLESQTRESEPLESQTGVSESQTGESEPLESQTGVSEPLESQTGVSELLESQTGVSEPLESQTGVSEPLESQTRESELVPMKESAEVSSEVQDQV